VWEIPHVKIVHADERKRVPIPDAKPGQAFAYESNGKGQITLLEVHAKAKEPAGSIHDGLKPLTAAEAKAAYGPNAEFDDLEHHCASLPAGPAPDRE
jgi:hypothetical protein